MTERQIPALLGTVDGNDKEDPDGIPRFAKALAEGFGFVQASRALAVGMAENTSLRELCCRVAHSSGRAANRQTPGLAGAAVRIYLRRPPPMPSPTDLGRAM